MGNRVQNLRHAIQNIAHLGGVTLLGCSKFRNTAPIGPTQPDYLNAVARIGTSLGPMELLIALKGLEKAHQRERTVRWGPRTLDLDILLFGNRILQHPKLVIPHPEMHRRSFVLEPMCDLAPGVRHPVLDRTVSELLQALS